MKIDTRDFGCIEADEKDIITFVKPILGFEEYTRFVMLLDDEVGDGFAWLQSVEEKNLCFVMANPNLLKLEYQPQIPKDCLEALENNVTEIWLMAGIKESLADTTVNLKSPIIINMHSFT